MAQIVPNDIFRVFPVHLMAASVIRPQMVNISYIVAVIIAI